VVLLQAVQQLALAQPVQVLQRAAWVLLARVVLQQQLAWLLLLLTMTMLLFLLRHHVNS
jgi:hypothetical protein